MRFLNLPYYVGLLSAAEFYGASHQKPQKFQVVIPKSRRNIQVGRVAIEFIKRKDLLKIPTKEFNTDSGNIHVSTPEATIVDLLCFPHHATGLDNILTIILEMIDQIDPTLLFNMTKILPESAWVQRLGYLLDLYGYSKISNILLKSISDRKLYWIHLNPNERRGGAPGNTKWKIAITSQVEPDLYQKIL